MTATKISTTTIKAHYGDKIKQQDQINRNNIAELNLYNDPSNTGTIQH